MSLINNFVQKFVERRIINHFIRNQNHWFKNHRELNNEILNASAIVFPDEPIRSLITKDKHIKKPLFNIGSSAKFIAMSLLLKKLKELNLDYNTQTFTITFDDFIEALWRGEIKYLKESKSFETIFKNLELPDGDLKEIHNVSKKIKENPNSFAGSILEEIKNGRYNGWSDKFPAIQISFGEMMFFVLTISSNSSYLTLISHLIDLYKRQDPNTRVDRLSDMNKDIYRYGIIKSFEFINPDRKFFQKRPNATTPEELATAFNKFISELMDAENEEVLCALRNNTALQECNFANRFDELQKVGELPKDLDIYEKTGISLHIVYGREFEWNGYPPHITFTTVFSIAKSSKILATISHCKTIAVLLPDPINPNRNYLREVKDKHIPDFINEIEEIVKSLNLNDRI